MKLLKEFLRDERGVAMAEYALLLSLVAVALLEESILPVLDKIAGDLQKNKNGYAPAISSLKLFLRQLSRRLAKVGGLV